jgi:hypothetical protein
MSKIDYLEIYWLTIFNKIILFKKIFREISKEGLEGSGVCQFSKIFKKRSLDTWGNIFSKIPTITPLREWVY